MEETLSSQYPYRGKILNLRVDRVRLPNGNESVREVAEHRGAVAMVALDAENNVLLVRQYRHAVGRELLEVPAGTVDEGETPEQTAPRELQEETGYTARKWELLARIYTSPGVITEAIHIYFARDLAAGAHHFMDDEDLQIEHVPLTDAVAMVERGEIVDAKTIIGLLLAHQKLAPTMTP
jgi:ADP-ribose pyrophosphatase